jgi:4'-phosphopantetheinyl transferase EntD
MASYSHDVTDEFDAFASRLASSAVLAKWKQIDASDQKELTELEQAIFNRSSERVRAAAGAARSLARLAIRELGIFQCDITKGPGGEPQWPSGVVGSLSHSDDLAISSISRRRHFRGIGVDIEPQQEIDSATAALFLTDTEIARYRSGCECLLFSIKEACFKACYHADGVMFDFSGIEVDVRRFTARTPYGRTVQFLFSAGTYNLAFAYVSA